MMNSLISLKGIDKSFGNRKIISELCFDLKEKEYVSIIGGSGSGKTTLLNILALFDSFDGGEYLLDGMSVNVNSHKASMLRSQFFGFVFQTYNLIPHKNVFDNIMLPALYVKKLDYKYLVSRVEQISEELQIRKLLHSNTDNLSGGEKQRVAIARAILLSPKIIIADEPTGNLDAVNTDIVLEILDRVNSTAAIIVVTHNQTVASRAHRRLELVNGALR